MAATRTEAAHLECDVVVVGLGPVGLMMSILLGRRGYRVVGFDRWPTPYPLPRAVTYDHEIARILGDLGIDSDNDPAIEYHDDHYLWINKDDEVLLEVDWISQAKDGWRNRYWFDQPALEDRFRLIASTLPNVTLYQGLEAVGLEQDDDRVTISYREVEQDGRATKVKEGGRTGTITARYCLGSDGANSFVRRALGQEFTDLNFYYDWLVVDTTPAVYPQYKTAHYQMCVTSRPTTVVPGGPGNRRWEFMLLPGEEWADMERPEKVWELLKPFGLDPEVDVLNRGVVWRFQAKYLEKWNHGRVMLAGDAAHLMPPFAGEGMCAGLRDVFNLAWRLDLIMQGRAGDDLLDQWSDERREHAKWYIDFSVGLANVICVLDDAEAAERDERMKAEHAVQSKIGPVSPHEAVLGPGTWLVGDELSGKPSVQSRVAYRGRTGRFDDVVARGWVLLTAGGAAGQTLSDAQLAQLESIGGKAVTIGLPGSGAEVIDVNGTTSAWMAEHGISHVLVRPDFYIALTARDESSLRSGFDSVMAAAGIAVAVPA